MSPHDIIVLIPSHCTGLYPLKKLLGAVRKLPVISSLKRVVRIVTWLAIAGSGLVAAGFLLFSFLVLPRLDHYRTDLAQQLTQALGRPVSIGKLSGSWDGLAPRFELHHLSISNPDGAALTLDQVAVKPSWMSLLVFEPRLSLIEIRGPSLDLRRGRDGLFYINGFSSGSGGGNGSAGNWLLRQSLIRVVDARISWQDQYFGLPPLTLTHGQFELSSGLFGHSLRLSGQPPSSVGSSIELNGSWRGDDTRNWASWHGSVSSTLHGARVDAWNRYMQAFGVVRSGEGDGRVDIAFDGGHITSLLADVRVKNAAYTMPGASEMTVPVMGGKLSVQRVSGGYQIDASHLTLYSQSGPVFLDSNINGRWNSSEAGGGNVRVDNVNLTYLSPFLHALGIDRSPLFQRFSPAGKLNNLRVSWEGKLDAPRRYQVESDFSALAWKPFGKIPGVDRVSGKVRFDQAGGQLVLSDASSMVMPSVFPKPIAFTRLNATIDWHLSAKGIDINLNRILFANRDVSGWVGGSYRYLGSGAGMIDLKAEIGKVDAERVIDYMPYQIGADTLRWLTPALRGGYLKGARLVLSGDLDRFPFRQGLGGIFSVEGLVHDGRLSYDKAWPLIENIDASLKFHNERMEISSSHATTLGTPLDHVQVSIPDLGAAVPLLLISGKAVGRMQDMLRFTVKSPVDGWLDGLTGKTRASGNSVLELGLKIPLAGHDPVRVNGRVHFDNNQVELSGFSLPVLESVNGELGFTERGVNTSGLHFRTFGGPFTLKANTDASARMNFMVEGQADSAQALAFYVPSLAPYVSGHAHYQGRFSIRNTLEPLLLSSDLRGTRLNAPGTLAKAEQTPLAFRLNVIPGVNSSAPLQIDFTAGNQAAGQVRLSSRGDLLAGAIGIGRNPGALPADGLAFRLALPSIDLRSWFQWQQSSPAATPSSPSVPLHVELASPDLNWGSYHLSNASLWVGHRPSEKDWHIVVDAAQLKGAIDYSPAGNGMIRARFPLMELNFSSYSSLNGAELSRMQIRSLPAMDVRIANLIYRGNSLGNLVLGARYVNQDWLLDSVNLKLPEGVLTGSLVARGASRVDSRFNLEATDLGKLLDRIGIRDAFRKGQGTMSGTLSWPGTLLDFNLARISGQVQANLSSGRFAQVNPGAARLLGAISLQSLVRRIKLDFTDVFSDGFAFDSLVGSARINQGQFVFDRLEMKAPAADVHIQGEINLGPETQKLRVHVEPHLAESVALATGAALINPVFGVAALAAQKVLRDPVGKIFSVDYIVTGKLTDPVVSKVRAPVSSTIRNSR